MEQGSSATKKASRWETPRNRGCTRGTFGAASGSVGVAGISGAGDIKCFFILFLGESLDIHEEV